MSLKITSTLAISGFGLLSIFACLVTGCMQGSYLYTQDRHVIHLPPRHENYENPDKYKVDSSAYPKYVIKRELMPPIPDRDEITSGLPFVKIQTTDMWYVTHKVGRLLLIFSDTYQMRECNAVWEHDKFSGSFKGPFGASCISRYLYCLYISQDGRIFGWKRLINPKRVALARDRYTIMVPPSHEASGWPSEPVFKAISRHRN